MLTPSDKRDIINQIISAIKIKVEELKPRIQRQYGRDNQQERSCYGSKYMSIYYRKIDSLIHELEVYRQRYGSRASRYDKSVAIFM